MDEMQGYIQTLEIPRPPYFASTRGFARASPGEGGTQREASKRTSERAKAERYLKTYVFPHRDLHLKEQEIFVFDRLLFRREHDGMTNCDSLFKGSLQMYRYTGKV